MVCHHCQTVAHKYGKNSRGHQRYHCLTCSRTFVEPDARLLGDMRLPESKALACLRMLLEGMSVRSTERLTGVHRDTVLRLLVLAGGRCERLLDRRIRGLEVRDVQADEIWGFVHCKQKTKQLLGYGDSVGDAYCYVAVERHTKLVLAWHLGARTVPDTEAFVEKLSRATTGKFQLSTDGWKAYPDAVSLSLGIRVSYAQVIKSYRAVRPQQSPEGERRYSTGYVLEVITVPRFGEPDPKMISTSHVERQNLTMRMGVRRLTRLTNAFSKKWDNLRAALALYFAHYNFCRVHGTIRCTPAMESGLTGHIWDVKELLER